MKFTQEDLKILDERMDQEEKSVSTIIPFPDSHYEELEECIALLKNENSTLEDKQASLSFFLTIFDSHDVRDIESTSQSYMEAHDLAYELANDLKEAHFEDNWSTEIDAKSKLLSGLVKNFPH